jgi:hypothetical protein
MIALLSMRDMAKAQYHLALHERLAHLRRYAKVGKRLPRAHVYLCCWWIRERA